jgi:hypothetical protein
MVEGIVTYLDDKPGDKPDEKAQVYVVPGSHTSFSNPQQTIFPMHGLLMLLEHNRPPISLGPFLETKADTQGHYRVGNLQPGQYTVIIRSHAVIGEMPIDIGGSIYAMTIEVTSDHHVDVSHKFPATYMSLHYPKID